MPDLSSVARWLVLVGIGLALLGGLVWGLARLGLPLGRLPGDFRFSTAGMTCFIPLATSLLLSLILTLAINVIIRLLRK
jgi:hypothetical protein